MPAADRVDRRTGEFPLLGLVGVAALVGVSGEEDEVCCLVDGIFDELVQG